MLKRLFGRSRFDDVSHDLYDAIVAQARQPAFYTHFAVPDSVDGRFDLVVLHAILTMRRLRRCGAEGEARVQKLFDLMFADFDRALREMGVGDLRVGKRIKQMAGAFYGRASTYGAALDGAETGDLGDALRRNLYGTADPVATILEAMAGHVLSQDRHLTGLPDEDILAGRLNFLPVPTLLRDTVRDIVSDEDACRPQGTPR